MAARARRTFFSQKAKHEIAPDFDSRACDSACEAAPTVPTATLAAPPRRRCMVPGSHRYPGLLGSLGIATLLGDYKPAQSAASAALQAMAGAATANGVDNLLAADAVQERMATPGVKPM
jgi:hypothetical protein